MIELLIFKLGKGKVFPFEIDGNPIEIIPDVQYNLTMAAWSQSVERDLRICIRLGLYDPTKKDAEVHCMLVFYEPLVLYQERWLRHIFAFLGIAFNPDVLHHPPGLPAKAHSIIKGQTK